MDSDCGQFHRRDREERRENLMKINLTCLVLCGSELFNLVNNVPKIVVFCFSISQWFLLFFIFVYLRVLRGSSFVFVF